LEIWLAIAAVLATVWYWQDSLRSRELALRRCRHICEQHDVQFLDQSVYVAKVQFARAASGKLCMRRFYAYEFSIGGVDRHNGVAVVTNHRVEYLSLLHPDGEIIEGSLSPNIDK